MEGVVEIEELVFFIHKQQFPMQSHIPGTSNDTRNVFKATEFPIVIKYTDPIVGLDKWPSVVCNWHVAGDKSAMLNLLFGFDSEVYDGLIKIVTADNEDNLITAVFTIELDSISATDKMNYCFNDDIVITGITLKEDKKSVEITVDKILLDTPITLYVKDVFDADRNRSFSGSASCSTDPDFAGTSTLMVKTSEDKSLYETILNQLNDAAGIQLIVNTSLLPSSDIILNAEQTGQLVQNWLGSIYQFIKDRSDGGDRVAAPSMQHIVSFIFDPDKAEIKNIFRLELDFVIKRLKWDMGDEGKKDILVSRTTVAPLSVSSGNVKNYSRFAKDLENVFSDRFELRVALGIDNIESQVIAESSLWAVRIYKDSSSAPGIGYKINTQEEPRLFAPRPISNQLISRRSVPICPFNKKTGIDYGNPVFKNLTDVNIDSWFQQLFENFDELLSPQYVESIRVVDSKNKIADPAAVSYLETLLAQKEKLADILKELMVPVFEAQATIDTNDIRERFKQALLAKLSNAYQVRSGLQFSAKVVENNLSGQVNLYGNVVQKDGAKIAGQTVRFTESKLCLKPNENAALTFLLIAPDLLGKQGDALSHISLDLSHAATHMEQCPSELPDNNGNKTTRLKFFSTESSLLSSRTLSDEPIEIPLPLNEFPALANMVGQSGQLSYIPGERPLSDLLKWDYEFSYNQTVHYPQDTLHFSIRFNLLDKREAPKELPDAFNAIAQFIFCIPEMRGALDELSRINIESDSTKLSEARITLSVYTSLVGDILGTCANEMLIQSRYTQTSAGFDGAYGFTLKESSTTVQGIEGVMLVLVEVSEAAQKVIGIPVVMIEGYNTERNCKNGICSYHFRSQTDGQLLKAADGQKTSKRTLVIEKLDIFARYEVSVSAYTRRNNELIACKTTNSQLVYVTGAAEFPDHYYPNFSCIDPINIACVSTGKPVIATLRMHLENLFRELLKGNNQSTLSVSVITTFSYEINKVMNRVQLPVMMQPVAKFNLKDPHCAPDEMLDNWTYVIDNWMEQSAPDRDNAMLEFNLSIFSNLAEGPKLLIQLSSLYLELINITPGERS